MKFIKMQSLGNDFVIIENQEKPKNISKICDRHFGIGCDQLMITNLNNDTINLNIFNQDGGMANLCGNGLICIAGRYFDLNPKLSQATINILPKKQRVMAQKIDNDMIKIELNDPIIEEDFINIGNLHKVINVGKTKKENILDFIKTKISKDDTMPCNDYNKNYISIQNNKIYIITIERGVGQTLACGSGALAAAIFAIKNNFILLNKVQIINHGSLIDNSKLYVEYDLKLNKVYLIGSYKYVFQGETF